MRYWSNFVLMLASAALAVQAGAGPEAAFERAKARAAAEPASAPAFERLAEACLRRGRETADPRYYREGLEAARQSLALNPGSYAAKRARVGLLVGLEQFEAAKDEALALQQTVKDDIPVYGYLVDAYLALGALEEAEHAAQWMLNLRPGNALGFEAGAKVRDKLGDWEGALEFLGLAFRGTPPSDPEQQAWLLTQIARVDLRAGLVQEAADTLNKALALVPNYPHALQEKRRLPSGTNP